MGGRRGAPRRGGKRGRGARLAALLAATGAAAAARGGFHARGGGWWPDLGPYRFEVDSGSAEARRLASVGMALGFNFNQEEARRAWGGAVRADPRCALCAWGLSLSYAPFLNKPAMTADDFEGGLAAAESAQAAVSRAAKEGRPTSLRVRGLVAAQAARFAPGGSRLGQNAGAHAYQRAMLALAEALPRDSDVLVLAAEATMLLHCDGDGYHFWTADRRALVPDGVLAAGLLERAVDAATVGGPRHPFALHLQIHLHEALVDGGAGRATAAAEALVAELGRSQAGHLQHMPSHTFLRVGRYAEAVAANVAAHSSNAVYLAHNRTPYGLGHNAAFLIYAADMAGLRAVSRDYGLVLRKIYAEPVEGDGMAQLRWNLPLASKVRFGDWAGILADASAQPQGGTYPYAAVLRSYARGLALIRSKRPREAEAELDALEAAAAAAEPFFEGFTKVARLVLEAALCVADARCQGSGARGGSAAAGISRLRDAAQEQASWAYDEPPAFHMPVAQCLGEALLAVGQPAAALAAFSDDLADPAPANPWSLYGALRALRALPGPAAAAEAAALAPRLRAAWHGPGASPASSCAALAPLP